MKWCASRVFIFDSVIVITVSQSVCLTRDTIHCENGWDHRFGACYKYFAIKKERDDAKNDCKIKNAHLAQPTNVSQNDYLTCLAGNEDIWLNIDRKGHDNWVDQDNNNLTYRNWIGSSIPNSDDCARIRGLGNGRWFSRSCVSTLSYVCVANVTDPCQQNPCGGYTCKPDGTCDYCSPNKCKNGQCKSVPSRNFPSEGTFNFTCECSDYSRYIGPTCELIDNPCKVEYGEEGRCKNDGQCEVIEKPNKNDWVCICPGELKRDQRKDCSSGRSENLIKYEIIQKVAIAEIAVPTGFVVMAWIFLCFWECYEIGELPDLDEASASSTSEPLSDTDTEEGNMEKVYGKNCGETPKGDTSQAVDEPPTLIRFDIRDEKRILEDNRQHFRQRKFNKYDEMMTDNEKRKTSIIKSNQKDKSGTSEKRSCISSKNSLDQYDIPVERNKVSRYLLVPMISKTKGETPNHVGNKSTASMKSEGTEHSPKTAYHSVFSSVESKGGSKENVA